MDCAEGKREQMPMTSSVKDMSLAKEARNCAKGAKAAPKTMTAESHILMYIYVYVNIYYFIN